MKWRVYYSDETTFDNAQGEPKDVPGLGVIVIVLKHKDRTVGSYIQHQADYYIWINNRWLACDLFRLWQYWFVQKYNHPKASLAGETVDNELYLRILRKAKTDKDFF